MSCLRPSLLSFAALALAVSGCTEPDPTYCDESHPCPAGQRCGPNNTCYPADAGPGFDGVLPLDGEPAKPDVPADLSDGAADDGGPDQLPQDFAVDGGKLPNGAPCTAPAACTSGYCMDGVCCNATCDGTCRACNLAGSVGTCSLIPQGQDPDQDCAGTDPACSGSCDGQGGCLFKDPSTACGSPTCASGQLTTHLCDGQGACLSDTTSCGGYACNTAGTACLSACTGSTECTAGFQCIGGKCVSNLPNGSNCGTNPKACASGYCVDGVCCDSACAGACDACNISGKLGTCSPVANGTTCGQATCSGFTLTSLVCDNGSCVGSPAPCPDYYACASSGQSCLTSCSSNTECNAALAYCAGTACTAKKTNGQTCTAGTQCTSGNCVDGVCCNSACTGACEACNLSGKAGTCSPVPNGSACGPTSCSGFTLTAQVCTNGSCGTSSSTCPSYYACNPNGVSCLTSCSSASDCNTALAYCDAPTCKAKLANGQTCTAGAQCTSGNCVDGVCCNSTCTGLCKSCALSTAKGTCTNIPSGQDPDSECTGADPACNGTCNGSGACTFPGTSVTCAAATCSSALLTSYHCNGAGTCTSTAQSCGVYQCNSAGTACMTSCTLDNQCVSPSFCHDIKCRSWVSVNSGVTVPLWSIWGTAANNIWAVGDAGTILHYTGSGWTKVPSSTTNTLKRVWGSGASNVWAVGGNGAVVHYTGSSWTASNLGSSTLHGIWGSSATDVWASGSAVYHYTGSGWGSPYTAAGGHSIWGSSSSDIYLLGYVPGTGSFIHYYNGSSWSAPSTISSQELQALFGFGSTSIWAVGANGVVVKYNGSGWSNLVPSPSTTQTHVAIWGASAADVWLAGLGSSIFHFNGTSWKEVPSGTGNHLFGMWGASNTDIWIVGWDGTILHLQ